MTRIELENLLGKHFNRYTVIEHNGRVSLSVPLFPAKFLDELSKVTTLGIVSSLKYLPPYMNRFKHKKWLSKV